MNAGPRPLPAPSACSGVPAPLWVPMCKKSYQAEVAASQGTGLRRHQTFIGQVVAPASHGPSPGRRATRQRNRARGSSSAKQNLAPACPVRSQAVALGPQGRDHFVRFPRFSWQPVAGSIGGKQLCVRSRLRAARGSRRGCCLPLPLRSGQPLQSTPCAAAAAAGLGLTGADLPCSYRLANCGTAVVSYQHNRLSFRRGPALRKSEVS